MQTLETRLDRLEQRDPGTVSVAWVCPVCGVADMLGYDRDCATHVAPPPLRPGERLIDIEWRGYDPIAG
jgi:hypothetical protein